MSSSNHAWNGNGAPGAQQAGASAPTSQRDGSGQWSGAALGPRVVATAPLPPTASQGSFQSAANAGMSPKDSFRMHQRRGSGALKDLLGGYSISVFADSGHSDAMHVDITDATSLADVHRAFGAALHSSRRVVGLAFSELDKEYVCPLTLVLLYPSLFSERRNPGRVFWPLYQYPDGFSTPPRRRTTRSGTLHTSNGQGEGGGANGAAVARRKARTAADPDARPPAPSAVAGAALYANASPLLGADGEPMEGRGRPLTAPPSDKTQGIARFRPTRREGHGRPLTAIPSDKTHGGRRLRPNRQEGHGRPMSAAPSTLRGTGAAQWRVSPLGDERTTTPASAGTGATDSDGGGGEPRVPSPRRRVAWGDATVSRFDAEAGAQAASARGRASDDDDNAAGATSPWGAGVLDVDNAGAGNRARGANELMSPVALPEFRHSRRAGGVTTGFGASALDAVDLQADGGSHTLGQFIAQRQRAASVRPTSAPAGGRRTRGGVTRTGPGWRQRFGVQRDAWVVVSASASGDSSASDEEPQRGPTAGVAYGSGAHESSVAAARRRAEDTPGALTLEPSNSDSRDGAGAASADVPRPRTAQGSPPATSPRYHRVLASPLMATGARDAFPGAKSAERAWSDDDAEDAASDSSGDEFVAGGGGVGGSDSGDEDNRRDLSTALSWRAWRPSGTRHFGLGPL